MWPSGVAARHANRYRRLGAHCRLGDITPGERNSNRSSGGCGEVDATKSDGKAGAVWEGKAGEAHKAQRSPLPLRQRETHRFAVMPVVVCYPAHAGRFACRACQVGEAIFRLVDSSRSAEGGADVEAPGKQ